MGPSTIRQRNSVYQRNPSSPRHHNNRSTDTNTNSQHPSVWIGTRGVLRSLSHVRPPKNWKQLARRINNLRTNKLNSTRTNGFKQQTSVVPAVLTGPYHLSYNDKMNRMKEWRWNDPANEVASVYVGRIPGTYTSSSSDSKTVSCNTQPTCHTSSGEPNKAKRKASK